jgi:P-type Mg2+ transporter
MPKIAAFWRQPVEMNLREQATCLQGLTAAEAAARLSVCGPNAVEDHRTFVFARKLLRRFGEPLIVILIAAAAVSAWAGDTASFWMISVTITTSILLDLLQEHRAEQAADALQRSVAVHADVWRDGRVQSLAARDLVPGDIVELRAGDLVPGDGVVIKSQNLFANEAVLTGEPYPVSKSLTPVATDEPAEAVNALFMGSSIISGSGQMLVVATGSATRFGAIAVALLGRVPVTAFERDMRQFGILIMRLTIFLVLFVVLAHIAFARPPLESFLFAIALAVGLTPGLLPMIMTVTLARGALRMATMGVIVKRLTAIHDLGAMDVLCTDKTGTLTESRIELVGHVGPTGLDDAMVFRLAWLNSHFETGIRSPLDQAILDHEVRFDVVGAVKIDEVPFDFERRRVSVLIEENGERHLIVKGAPEDVLAHATHVEMDTNELVELDVLRRAKIMETHDKLAAEGQRLLGVAWRQMPASATSAHIEDEHDLMFCGFVVFLDPPKKSAIAALAKLHNLGIAVKVISGDNELVVRHVAGCLGLESDVVLNGSEIAKLDDSALRARVETTTLFSRVDPGQKSRIIQALKDRGHTVGYLGDGINDAPALRLADIGISVECAVDVAKQASGLVLTRPDLSIVAACAAEGRRTFSNIRKYVLMGTSSNFGNMVSMAAASVFLPFLPMLPVQILLNNLIYDVSEIGIPFDTVDISQTATPQVWDMAALRRFTILMGLVSSVFDLATFWLLLKGFNADAATFHTGWFMESMATQILVIFIIRTRGRPWISTPDSALVITSLSALGLAFVLPFTAAGRWFQFVAIEPTLALALVSITALYLLTAYVVRQASTV